MNRLERNRQHAILIISRIERNIELSRLCKGSSFARAGQFIRAGQETKLSLQQLHRYLQPKKETYNV